MSEEKRLAEWLMDPTHPSGLSTEVEEAVYILRPDLAPPANIDIDDIWNAARAIPQEGAEDVGLVEDIFAHQKAPAARVSINDIFADLTTGPLSTPTKSVEEVSFDNVVQFRPLIKKPIFLGGLVAALALIILLPTRFQSASLPEPQVTLDDSEVFSPQKAKSDSAKETAELEKEVVYDGGIDVRKGILHATESFSEQPASSKSAASPMSRSSAPKPTSPPVSSSQVVLAVESANYASSSTAPLDDGDGIGTSSDLVANNLGSEDVQEASPALEPASGSSLGRSSQIEMKPTTDDMGVAEDAFPEPAGVYVETEPVIKLRSQLSCQMPPYAQPVPFEITEALALSGADKVGKVQTLLGSATGDEMIYLIVEIFPLLPPSEAVTLLESALRVVGTSLAFRCAGYRYLGEYYFNQGDLVKAEGYYRQAGLP